MTTCFLAPDPIQSTQFIPGGNTPANGGQLFFYAAGSSTKQTVYKDNAAAVSWTNPIVLDSGGNLPSGGEVWFPQGQTFKVIFAPSNDTDPPASPYWTKDNLSGTNDVSAQTGSEWVSGPTPTFVSTTQFTVAGDQTSIFTAGRRIKTTNTAGTVYSTVMNAVFGAVTTVNVVSDGVSVLDSGLSATFYSVLDPANPSVSSAEIYRKGTAIASAGNGTTNIWASSGDYVHITGTNAIYFFSTAPYAGAQRDLVFDGALPLVHASPTLSLPGLANISTSAGDVARVRADTVSTYTLMSYQREGIAPLASTAASGTIFAGPATGASSVPSLRAIAGADAAWTLVSTVTVNSSSSVNFPTQFTADYKEYQLHLSGVVPVAHNISFYGRVTTDNGATYITTAGYRHGGLFTDNASSVSGDGNQSEIQLPFNLVPGLHSSVANALSGVITIYNPADTAFTPRFHWDLTFFSAAGYLAGVHGDGRFNNSGGITGMQLFMSTGNISTGVFSLYGLRKS